MLGLVMTAQETTCWTLIHAAAEGHSRERELFAERYLGPVRAYLGARWNNQRYRQRIDDAVQDVFCECFRKDGPLSRVTPNVTTSFRAYLYGIVRNVARRIESHDAKHGPSTTGEAALKDVAADEATLTQVFDRAWAGSIMRQASQRHQEIARAAGANEVRRFELLRLRFHEELPIRKIAEQWEMDAAVLHREYQKARQEFRTALLDVVRFNHPGTDAEIEREASALLGLLS